MRSLFCALLFGTFVALNCAQFRPQCSPVRCPADCRQVLRGPCPSCECNGVGGGGPNPGMVQCSPPNCAAAGCTLQRVFSGPCPGCDCPNGRETGGGRNNPGTVQCSPPICPAGCKLQTVFSGPCPGCDCPNNGRETGGMQCAPVNCPAGCVTVYNPGQCPSCNCRGVDPGFGGNNVNTRPQCSPPRCEPGCQIVNRGPCPSCDCSGRQGRSAWAGINRPACSMPNCAPGCTVQRQYRGPCPGCDCPRRG